MPLRGPTMLEDYLTVSNFAQQHPITCNRVRKRTQQVTPSILGPVGQEFCVRLHETLKSY